MRVRKYTLPKSTRLPLRNEECHGKAVVVLRGKDTLAIFGQRVVALFAAKLCRMESSRKVLWARMKNALSISPMGIHLYAKLRQYSSCE